MKKITYFYLENCPYCKKADKIMEQLTAQKPVYAQLEIERIEERKQPHIANSFDYYYVPCFYIEGQKLHEGALSAEKLEEIFEMALN